MSWRVEPVLTGPELALCRSLARNGVSLVRNADRFALQRLESDGRRSMLAEPAAAAVERCVALGLLAEREAGFVLSSKGRSHLRRLASRPKGASKSAGSAAKVKLRQVVDGPLIRADQDDTLAWLRRRKDGDDRPLISAEAFEAGERLRNDFLVAGMLPRITQSWSPTAFADRERQPGPGGALEEVERIAAAKTRVRKALVAVGPEQGRALLDLCCHAVGVTSFERRTGWPQRSGTRLLRMALEALARHYGLLQPDDGAWLARVGLGHWGSDDFKPTLGAWRS